MWTLITGIDFQAAKRRAARAVVTATVLLGTGTQLAMALYPAPAAASTEAAAVEVPGTTDTTATNPPAAELEAADGA
jgi:hypothetical protein